MEFALAGAGLGVRVRSYGIPRRFLDHATRAQVLDEVGLTPDPIATDLLGRLG